MPPHPRPVPPGTRWCNQCSDALPLERFSATGRVCRYHKYLAHLRKRCGITEAQFIALRAKQGDLCAICRRRPHKYVDHDHKTGEPRSLLCQPCNTALGAFFEDPEIFARASEYVTSASSAPAVTVGSCS